MAPSAPTSSLPPPSLPKKPGGGPYIAASVFLVLAIIGGVWFKFSREKPPPPPPVVQIVSADNKNTGPIFDIPAPPPIEAGSDAAPDASKTPSTAPSLCNGPCNGSGSPALRAALSSAAGTARGCYTQALRTNTMLEGRMVVSVRVSATGAVCSASIIEDTVHSPQVSSCVLSRFNGKRFSSFTDGKCVDVNVPLSFKQQEGNQ